MCADGGSLFLFRSITAGSKSYDNLMRVTSKGQVTIPLRIREKYGLMPETQVEFVERDGDVIVKKATHRRGTDRADRLV